MEETLRVINQMRSDGVIGKYAIGGAVGATFYLEPTSTFDIDIFIAFAAVAGSLIVSPEHIYSYLKKMGYEPEGEHVLIKDWHVQFLPADDKLNNEALTQANETNVGGVQTWVMKPEHLMAMALKTGRGKDMVRLQQFVERKSFDASKLNEILARNGLLPKWKQFKQKYIKGD